MVSTKANLEGRNPFFIISTQLFLFSATQSLSPVNRISQSFPRRQNVFKKSIQFKTNSPFFKHKIESVRQRENDNLIQLLALCLDTG